MNKKISTIFMLLCCILIVSCSNEDEHSSLSVIGAWNATTLIEDEVYTDLEKEEHNEVEIRAHLQSSVFKLSKDLIDSIHEEGIVAYTS